MKLNPTPQPGNARLGRVCISLILVSFMDNPALRQESRYEPASVIPLKNKHSLLDWLSSENRLIPREIEQETEVLKEEDDMAGLMEDVEDNDYEDDENASATEEEGI